MAPRVSVLVPLYNKAAYIRRCLDSIFGQAFSDFELLVVNDGSTDDSPQIVAGYQDPRLRLIHQPNAGPGAARNRGAREAHGHYLAMLDGDDSWQPEFLAESVRVLDAAPSEVASLTWTMLELPMAVSTTARWRKAGMPPSGVFRVTPETSPRVVIAMMANMLPSSTVMRREPFLALGGFYDKYRCLYSEDAWLYLKTLLNYPLAFDTRPLVNHYIDASELSLNLAGVRPIEPFLEEPEGIRESCPGEMRPLLDRVLALRAAKTASVYGYWSRRKEARRLLGRFVRPRDWRSPLVYTALLGCTPLGGWAGAGIRAAVRLRRSMFPIS